MNRSISVEESVNQLSSWLQKSGTSLFTNEKELSKVISIAKVTQERVAGFGLASKTGPTPSAG